MDDLNRICSVVYRLPRRLAIDSDDGRLTAMCGCREREVATVAISSQHFVVFSWREDFWFWRLATVGKYSNTAHCWCVHDNMQDLGIHWPENGNIGIYWHNVILKKRLEK